MPQIRYKDDLDSLAALAEHHDGYFLASEASQQGVDHLVLARLAEAGHVDRLLWGVYRLARWPAPKHADLWPLALWAKGKGFPMAFSHRTALQLHDVSDINPSRIDITLPREVRFRGKLPSAVVVHNRDLAVVGDVVHINDLPVTSLRRTFLDLLVDRIAVDTVNNCLFSPEPPDALTQSDLDSLRALYDLDPGMRDYLVRYGKQLHKNIEHIIKARNDIVHGKKP